MTAHAINEFECVPVDGRCLMHDEDLVCSHICDGCPLMLSHVGKCDDPPPPAYVAALKDTCIGCGQTIHPGELARMYEEGPVHADGCPEKDQPS